MNNPTAAFPKDVVRGCDLQLALGLDRLGILDPTFELLSEISQRDTEHTADPQLNDVEPTLASFVLAHERLGPAQTLSNFNLV